PLVAFLRRRRDDVVASPGPAGPMTRDALAQRLGARGDRLLPAVRYATRRQPDAAIDIGQSKVGGAPDLPQGTSWPLWTTPGGERLPLQFFAQLDLAEAAAAAPGPLGLPETGLLSFFADFDPEGKPRSDAVTATIRYSPADSLFVRCALRLMPLQTAHLAAIGAWSWPVPPDGDGLDPLALEYDLDLSAQVPERYELTGHHQLFGHNRFGASSDDAVPVLQLDCDGAREFCWEHAGAGGALVWSLPRTDIAAREWAAGRFSLA
ncbi:MAG: DUF1963 domain-containing protein, partial [Acidimicrobiales bacterium]